MSLEFYKKHGMSLIPLHVYNKKIKGNNRGKTPIHLDWTTKSYPAESYDKWVAKGLNVGYRLNEKELVVDLDPRNYVDEIDSEQIVADLFNMFDFDELLESTCSVLTGGGGVHIYLTLPDDCDYKLLRKCVKDVPGVDFKKKGGYVVGVGSRHPSGNMYEFINEVTPTVAPDKLLRLIKRKEVINTGEYKSGYGALSGAQLQEMILDKLDVLNYGDNDSWLRIMMGCHHATGGEGLEEFIEWSTSDPKYSNEEHRIRVRWDSLKHDKAREVTVGSLIQELKFKGEMIVDVQAALDFNEVSHNVETEVDEDLDDSEGMSENLTSTEETEFEEAFIKLALEAGKSDDDDLLGYKVENIGVNGAAIAMARELDQSSSDEDVMKCVRLINAAGVLEATKAKGILAASKVISKGDFKQVSKDVDGKVSRMLGDVLAAKSLNETFNKGKFIISEPNGQVWVYNKVFWMPISDRFLEKLVLKTLEAMMSKGLELTKEAISVAKVACSTICAKSSSARTKLFDVNNFKPVINCKNGEVWIRRDGSHVLKPHRYKSYQMGCLNVNYDPSAECPLFMQTLREIFDDHFDRDEIIDYMGEVFGYIIQPYKPDAQWWIFMGRGGDGKSSLIKIMAAILGDAYYSADEKLLDPNYGGNNHAVCDLVGKLLVGVEELSVGKVLSDTGVKRLSENTRKTANPKNKDTYSFEYIGSLIMCSNNVPTVKDTSEGMTRRANIVPFTRQFNKHGIDDPHRITNIIKDKDELSGVLNFMLDGYKRYAERGKFSVPKTCLVAKDDWFKSANNLVRFVDDNIEIGDRDDFLGYGADVFLVYKNWCDDNGVNNILGRNKFYDVLEGKGFLKSRRNNQVALFGGKLKDIEITDFYEFEEL